MIQCDHSHVTPSQKTASSSRLKWVLLLSITYMVAEIVGGIMSGSLALLADAGHMAIDSAAVALGIFAAWISEKPPDSEKTYGYYRAEILAALVNGATLIAISFWIFFEAWHRLSSVEPVAGGLMGAIASGGLFVNFLSLWIMHENRASSVNLRAVWLHIATDALGSLAAIVASFLVWKWQWYKADPLISIFIGVLILFGAWQLVRECVNVLLEAVPKGINLAEIRKGLQAISQVAEVHDLHIWTLATGVPSFSAHIRVNDSRNASQVLSDVTAFLRDHYKIEHVTVQIEPPDFVHRVMPI